MDLAERFALNTTGYNDTGDISVGHELTSPLRPITGISNVQIEEPDAVRSVASDRQKSVLAFENYEARGDTASSSTWESEKGLASAPAENWRTSETNLKLENASRYVAHKGLMHDAAEQLDAQEAFDQGYLRSNVLTEDDSPWLSAPVPATEDLATAGTTATAGCYVISTGRFGPPGPSSIRFEFDLSYGASTVSPPLRPTPCRADPAWCRSVYGLEGLNITNHRLKRDHFRVEGDGNRLEIATERFPLSDAGRIQMRAVMSDVMNFAADIRSRCKATKPAVSLAYPSSVGAPRFFTAPYLEPGVACLFPLSLSPRQPYYRQTYGVAASPQATFSLPLASLDALVSRIKHSERNNVAGAAWSGPDGERQGDRSVALYEAQDAVNRSRTYHLSRQTVLSDGTAVSSSNYSATLQGLLILLVSYLRAGEVRYDGRDWEVFAKAYLPLNVKNPFRLLFKDLTPAEKRVFHELYDSPRTNLWSLVRTGAGPGDGGRCLFPSKVGTHQLKWFTVVPTWNDLVEKTITNSPLTRSVAPHPPGSQKKGEEFGCEVLFAPLSHIVPYEVGSRRVTVEMRRLGFNWVFASGYVSKSGTPHPGWRDMTNALFDMALELNQ